jgi:hypothetical protein
MGHKGKFYASKAPHFTFIDAAIKDSSHNPGVGKYDMLKSPRKRILGFPMAGPERISVLDEAQWKGMTTPAPY